MEGYCMKWNLLFHMHEVNWLLVVAVIGSDDQKLSNIKCDDLRAFM
jgi:hypothetical protein